LKKLFYTVLLIFSVCIPISCIYVNAYNIPIVYSGKISIDIPSNNIITNAEDYEFNIKSTMYNDNKNEKIKNCERTMKISIYENEKEVFTEKISTTKDSYSYKLPTSKLKNKSEVTINIKLFSPKNERLAEITETLKLKSSNTYKKLIIKTNSNIDWNLHTDSVLKIPVVLSYKDKKGDVHPLTIKNMIQVTSNDGKTYTVSKMDGQKNKYMITIKKDIVKTGTLGLIISLKNTNVSYETKVVKISIRNEDVIENLSIPNNSYSMNRGGKLQINPIFSPYNSSEVIKWSSSNPEVATVDANGIVTGITKGKTTITAKTKYTTSSTVVTVKAYLSSINPSGVHYVEEGKTQKLKFTIKPTDADIDLLSYTSSNTRVVDVDENGILKAYREGESTITITDGEITSKVKVVVLPRLMRIDVEKTSIGLIPGEDYQISITPVPNTYTKALNYTYTSSDTNVCTVNKSGLIKAKNFGTATITIKHDDITRTITVKVNSQDDKISVTDSYVTISKPFDLSNIVESNIPFEELTISVENDDIIEISNSGTAVPMKEGTTTISISTGSATDYVEITVDLEDGDKQEIIPEKVIQLTDKNALYNQKICPRKGFKYKHFNFWWLSILFEL